MSSYLPRQFFQYCLLMSPLIKGNSITFLGRHFTMYRDPVTDEEITLIQTDARPSRHLSPCALWPGLVLLGTFCVRAALKSASLGSSICSPSLWSQVLVQVSKSAYRPLLGGRPLPERAQASPIPL